MRRLADLELGAQCITPEPQAQPHDDLRGRSDDHPMDGDDVMSELEAG